MSNTMYARRRLETTRTGQVIYEMVTTRCQGRLDHADMCMQVLNERFKLLDEEYFKIIQHDRAEYEKAKQS